MKFNYIGPVNSTGYGQASIGLLLGLKDIADPKEISLVPIGLDNNAEGAAEVTSAYSNTPDYNYPTFCFWHLSDIHTKIKDCKAPVLGYTTFELDTLAPQEVKNLDLLTAVATASRFGKDVLDKYTKHSTIKEKDTKIITHAFRKNDTTQLDYYKFDYDKTYSLWSKFLAPINIPKDTLFLSTAGKYESRKAHPELIKACIEYGKTKPVLLISFLYNPFIPGNFPYGFINSNMLYPLYTNAGFKVYKKDNFYLVLMPPAGTKKDLHNALKAAHFFVSPSKAEGWNLPLFEMLSQGMPSIATLTSAHTHYASSRSVIDVSFDSYIPALDGIFFNGHGSWANVTSVGILEAIQRASKLLETPTELELLSEFAIKTTKDFTWEREAKNLLSLMKQL
jgi:glycosyltransferase involved in cell wall biosynthesis